MKTVKYALLLIAVLALTTGCRKEYITKEYITEQTIVQGLDMTLIDFNVEERNWETREVENGNDDEGYFEAILEVPEITDKVVKEGKVMVDRIILDNNSYVFTPLPFTFTTKTFLDEDPYYYNTHIDFEWRKGAVHIYVTTSDLYIGGIDSDLIVPEAMSFRVAIQL